MTTTHEFPSLVDAVVESGNVPHGLGAAQVQGGSLTLGAAWTSVHDLHIALFITRHNDDVFVEHYGHSCEENFVQRHTILGDVVNVGICS